MDSPLVCMSVNCVLRRLRSASRWPRPALTFLSPTKPGGYYAGSLVQRCDLRVHITMPRATLSALLNFQPRRITYRQL
jgi:hypothetical protein